MPMITEFKEFFKDQNYDRTNNPKQLPINDLLPIGISWSVENNTYRLDLKNGAIVHLLSDMSGIAIVEMENEQLGEVSRACIINACGNVRFEIQLPAWAIANGRFYDVYYIENDLCFFFFSNNEDYRMIVDAENGNIKDVLKSR